MFKMAKQGLLPKENIEGQHTHLFSMPIREDTQKAMENEGKTIKPK